MIIALARAFGVGACTTVCDCEASFDGLTITASAPVTAVALSGTACATGRFNCDYTLTNTCSQIRVEAVAAGPCIVDLTVGGTAMRVEREMVWYGANCCGRGHFGATQGTEYVDLRMTTP